ncbi:seipin co-factor family protein [Aspergillus clavatus NRRL 1]|uniref:Uncharacterized protein n=1 Tax=Aspergillus clavatus (strain ATCC 1007 / CBS 513.65 / DSM 816 / NCTC 3887 / NRRL 1 / QM 1276 / 107) TaxID=344612 RepID=A1CSE7_ASPCL|nr:uncharacterized protein ACLA_033040 [Aspergillus clavatus NRRL 1]EAW08568.1 conserved hypothetical protein [Aspergillus clavatus NRRL 1]
MSLNTVTGGLDKGLPTKSVDNLTAGTVNKTTDQVNKTTKDVTDTSLPGAFPSDDRKDDKQPAPEISLSAIWSAFTGWIASFFPNLMDRFENWVKGWVMWLLPPPRQAQLYEAALKRPIASTFLVCQAVCCGVPLLVFLAGVFVFAAVAILLWAVLSLLIVGPILLVASMMGISLWGWGWVLYGLVKWVDQRFLGGMIMRFWLSNAPQSDGGESASQGKSEKRQGKPEKLKNAKREGRSEKQEEKKDS